MGLGTNPSKVWKTNAQTPQIDDENWRYQKTNMVAKSAVKNTEEDRRAVLQASRNQSVAYTPAIPGKIISSKINGT